MIDRATKLRWRRKFRQRRRQVEAIGVEAEQGFEKLFVRRLARLIEVRRFVGAWMLLMVLLITGTILQTRALSNHYLVERPVPGGTFTEGILGAFTNANPLYATGPVDGAVSKLLFSGLMRYNEKNALVGDLAASLETKENGEVYQVVLKDNLQWHDGTPITADDVLFTYRLIQNPDARSPLFTSWSGIKIKAKDAKTIIFTLPNPLASFPHSLTNGIVPKHRLEGIEVTQLRSIDFNNTSPVGSGPFKWSAIEVSGGTPENREEHISLTANQHFHRGAPKLERFIVRTFRSEQRLINAFEAQELTAVAGLESQPDTLKPTEFTAYNIPLTGQVSVFLKTTDAPLDDIKVRQAIVQATDTDRIIRGLGYPVIASDSPVLERHFIYDKSLVQLPFNKKEAIKKLEESGWKLDGKQIRTKGGKALSLRLFAEATSEYAYVTQELQRQWKEVGIDLQIFQQPADELQSIAVAQHSYDVLLYGISLGTDPDVFPYWHSSQASTRSSAGLNFSEYQSAVADESLEAGRTRIDKQLRAVKYRPFLEAWRADAPAISLYQPRFLYISDRNIAGFNTRRMNIASDRYSNVEKWMVRRDKVLKPLK